MKVLASDKISNDIKKNFEKKQIEINIKTDLSPEQLKEEIIDYDGLIIRSKTTVTKEIIEAAKNLKVIGRAGIGVDNIDLEEATKKGIVVMNTPLGNTITTAEHTIAMIFCTARQIPYANLTMHRGQWEKSAIKGVELTGKILGLIGCGNIGSIVANRAKGLLLKVIVYDPFLTETKAKYLGITLVSLPELLDKADFISIHTPLTEKTKNLISEANILKMKDQVRIINCARGGVVNEKDLVTYLKNGKIASAALDVFPQEPLPKESSFLNIPSLILTPHLGASTQEAQERVSLEIAEQVSDFLKNGTIINGYNVPSLSQEAYLKLLPYKKIMAKLGNFIAQIRKTAYKKIIVEYNGKVLELPSEPLLNTLLKSLMTNTIDSINEINALTLVKNRGILIQELKNQDKLEYNSLITLKVITEKNNYEISATLFGETPRIVSINEIPIEVDLLEYNLYLDNQDEPGFVKDLANVLFEGNINIASFHLGRKSKGGNALAVVTLDTKPTDALLEKINKIALINSSELIIDR